MATIGSAKATLVNKIDSLTSSATAKDTIFLAKALKENSSLNNFVWQGNWAATTEYSIDDVVASGGSTYMCKAAHTSGSSFALGSDWDMMAEAGTTVGTGTAGQVLKTDSAGTGVEWGELSSTLAGLTDVTISTTNPTISTNPSAAGSVWINKASGEVFTCIDNTSSANVWKNAGTGTAKIAPVISASGGTTYTYSHKGVNYKIHKFTSSGTFTVSSVPAGGTIDSLVIGGGGGGGNDNGGGGGASGVVWTAAASITTGSHSVSIGSGGAARVSGNDSSFRTATALGGGGGTSGSGAGGNGGCGGGGARDNFGGASTQGDSGGIGFGFSGNICRNRTQRGGGGGGAGEYGTHGTEFEKGRGGFGINNFVDYSISETQAFLLAAVAGTDSTNTATTTTSKGPIYIASGGAGGSQEDVGVNYAPGGAGGNTVAADATGEPAQVNTGSGGGSSGTGGGTGGNGGSGIVIIRYEV